MSEKTETDLLPLGEFSLQRENLVKVAKERLAEGGPPHMEATWKAVIEHDGNLYAAARSIGIANMGLLNRLFRRLPRPNEK